MTYEITERGKKYLEDLRSNQIDGSGNPDEASYLHLLTSLSNDPSFSVTRANKIYPEWQSLINEGYIVEINAEPDTQPRKDYGNPKGPKTSEPEYGMQTNW